MLNLIVAAATAVLVWSGTGDVSVRAVHLGGYPTGLPEVCGAWPPPVVEDTPAALQVGLEALPGGDSLEERIRHWRLLLYLICRYELPEADRDLIVQADLEECREDVRQALAQVNDAALSGEVSKSQAVGLLHTVATCSVLDGSLFGACLDGASREVSGEFGFGAPLGTLALPTAIPPTVPVPTATSIPPIWRMVSASNWRPASAGIPDEAVLGGLGLVGLLAILAVGAFGLYLVGGYFRAFDVQAEMRKSGAEGRSRMDEVSEAHLQAATATVVGGRGDRGP